MLILKGIFFGMALFIVGAVIYTLLGCFLGLKFAQGRGLGTISTGSPFLWLFFAASLAIGYVIAVRGLWILEGLLLGGVIFIVGTVGYGIFYNRRLMKLHPHPPGTSIGVSVRHLRRKLAVVLISSVAVGLAIIAAVR